MIKRKSGLRRKVFARDDGICAECGADTKEREAAFERDRAELRRRLREGYGGITLSGTREAIEILAKEHGIKWQGFGMPAIAWEADHILALAEGGEDTIDNAQTLCVPCHLVKTVEHHQRSGKMRRMLGKKFFKYRKMFGAK